MMRQAKPRPTFRLKFLGKQSLNRPRGTGFGCVQKSLRTLYLGHVTADVAQDELRAYERTVILDEGHVHFRYWEPNARQFQQDTFPFGCMTYVDLVFFHTVKGRKRHFGYFRRYTDSSDVIPESVLIPLHKKDHKLLSQMHHKPLVCMILRRPFGIQFLECHLYSADTEDVALSFVQEFDLRSKHPRQENEGNVFNYAPWYERDPNRMMVNRWQSQPLLLQENGTLDSDRSEPLLSPDSTASKATVHRAPLEREADVKEAALARTASGTIFDKYKELQQFNISDYDYMYPSELDLAPPALPPRKAKSNPQNQYTKAQSQQSNAQGPHIEHLSHHSKDLSQQSKDLSHHSKDLSHHSKDQSHHSKDQSNYSRYKSQHGKDQSQYSHQAQNHQREGAHLAALSDAKPKLPARSHSALRSVEEAADRPVARVSPSQLPGSVQVLPATPPLLRSPSVNPHRIQRRQLTPRRGSQPVQLLADSKATARGNVQQQLQGIDLQSSSKIDFSTALGYLP